MATQNVRFYFGTQERYEALVEKNPVALYFIEDTQRLYKGDKLLAVGTNATELASGLMSAADKAKLDALTVSGISNLIAIDATITIADTEDGSKSIGVAVASREDNALVVTEDGLFVAKPEDVSDIYATKEEVIEQINKIEENLVWSEIVEFE